MHLCDTFIIKKSLASKRKYKSSIHILLIKVISSESGEKHVQIKHSLQAKTIQNN